MTPLPLPPRSLRLGPRRYYLHPTPAVEMKDEEGHALYGDVDHDTAQIRYRDDLRGWGLWSTLLHEALHAIDDHCGLDLGEQGIRTLETELARLVQDNPGFLEAYISSLDSPL